MIRSYIPEHENGALLPFYSTPSGAGLSRLVAGGSACNTCQVPPWHVRRQHRIRGEERHGKPALVHSVCRPHANIMIDYHTPEHHRRQVSLVLATGPVTRADRDAKKKSDRQPATAALHLPSFTATEKCRRTRLSPDVKRSTLQTCLGQPSALSRRNRIDFFKNRATLRGVRFPRVTACLHDNSMNNANYL